MKLKGTLKWNNNVQHLPLLPLQSTSQAFIKLSLITPLGHRCSKYLHERWVSKTQKTLHKYSSDWLYELIHFSCTLVLSFPTEFQAIKFYCREGFAGNELQSCTQENLLLKGTWADPSKEQEQQLCKSGPLRVWGNNPNVKLCIVSTSLTYAFLTYIFILIKQLKWRGKL